MKKSFILLLLYSCVISYSQKIIIDNNTLDRVPFIEIYTLDGSFIGINNDEGVITKDLVHKILKTNSTEIIFKNAFYNDYKINIVFFEKEETFKVEKKIEYLEEITLNAFQKPKYLKLKGFFRSTQLNNEEPYYYIDGVVTYYIKLKNNSVKIKIEQNRSYYNKNQIEISKQYHFSIAGAPSLNEFFKEHSCKNIDNLVKSNFIIEQQQFEQIKEKDTFKNIGISIVNEENPKTYGLFGLKSVLNNFNIFAIYNSNSDTLAFKDLYYFNEKRNYNIIGRNNTNYKINSTHEFFLLEKEYTNEIESKKFDKSYVFIKENNIIDKYWERISNLMYDKDFKGISPLIIDNEDIKK